MGINKVNKAFFLDRDGIINKMVFDKNKNEYRPPHFINEVKFIKNSLKAIKLLNENSYYVFVVSNQPDYAKGKTSLENLLQVKDFISNVIKSLDIVVYEYYYCYHHPEGVVREYSLNCKCRKPGTYFIDIALEKYSIRNQESYFVGDRESDVLAGFNSGLKTVYVRNTVYSIDNSIKPDYIENNLYSMVKKIIN